MSRAQPKPTPTDEHARRIARAIAKGRLPPLTHELERYCESAPREVFAAFAGVARHLPPAGDDQALAAGYLVLLQRLLETLRYRTDRGYVDAAELIAEFQSDVVRQVRTGQVDAGMLAVVGDALHQSKIAASPELAALAVEQPVERDDDGSPPDIRAGFDEILEACGGDPFETIGTLMKGSHAMPGKPASPSPVPWCSAAARRRAAPRPCRCSTPNLPSVRQLPERSKRSPRH
jgi:hypothetical protein